jgi:hypothetical protein
VKRNLFLTLSLAVAVVTLAAPVSWAASRCTDEPERCVRSTATPTPTRPAVHVASAETPTPAPASTPAVAPARRASAPAVIKATPKPVRPVPRGATPTPGMILLKLATGGGDISWLAGHGADGAGQSWVL